MTPHQKQLVRESFSLVRPISDAAAVQAMGRRHASYGVRAAHYASVAEALLWTLGKGLGDAWTSEHEDAWVAVYGSLSSMMLTAAVEVNSPPARAA